MFWGPSVWAGLRAGDAGNAEEELGVQQNTSAVYPTGRVALALRAQRHSAAGLPLPSGFVALCGHRLRDPFGGFKAAHVCPGPFHRPSLAERGLRLCIHKPRAMLATHSKSARC